MPIYDLFGDTSGLPQTTASGIPYEIEALTPREVWGAGNNSTTLICRQKWDGTASWIQDMVGRVTVIKPGSTLLLKRYVPEMVQYGDGRRQFCSICEQTEQGGNADNSNFSQAGTNWPETDWTKFRTVFEAFPYAVLTDPECDIIATAAGGYAGAKELYRYVVRSRRDYSREQPIPAASLAGGFRVATGTIAAPGQTIGQVGFRAIGMADITFKWVRVPVGWPPPVGYTPADPSNPWPPAFNPAALNPAANRRTRDSFLNCINDDWFDVAAPDGICAPPGTLLYTGYDDSNRYYDANGEWVCDITFSFKQKQAIDSAGSYGGWNYFLDARGRWVRVNLEGIVPGTVGATDTPPYQSKPFNDLFKYS